MGTVDRLERLTDLILVLLDAVEPLTLDQIGDAVIGYPEAREGRRQAFERDKRTLREEGIVLTLEHLDDGTGRQGYRIRPEDYYLPELELSPEEQVALNLAVAGVHLDDPIGRDALLKLGVMERDGPPPLAALPSLPALPALHEALRDHRRVRFGYRGRERTLDPYAVVFRRGWWYVAGRDAERQARRTFRVDRIEGLPRLDRQARFTPPEELDPAELAGEGPWRLGDEEAVVAEVEIDALLAGEVEAQLGAEAVLGRGEDGSVRVGLQVTNVDGLVSWVLGLLDHAVVLGPPQLREAVVARLEGSC